MSLMKELTMRHAAAVLAPILAGTTLAAPAQAAEPPTRGGCKAFGQNVAQLGQNLGPLFGYAASTTARVAPGYFQETIVEREQQDLCP